MRESAAEAVDLRVGGIEDRSVGQSWEEHRVGGSVNVFEIARPKSADRWALGHFRRLFRVSTAFLHSREGGWDQVFTVKGRLDSIGVLGDGSVLAVGESESVLFDGDQWSTIASGLPGCRRIWGANPACANALSDGLSYFGGKSWERVDLDAQGVVGRWADGDSDASGMGWIVGWTGTFSCMAVGSGRNWQRDGCGAEDLYLIHVAPDGRAFAVSGNEVFRHDGMEWREVVQLHPDAVPRAPLTMSSAGELPIVVAFRFLDVFQGGGDSGLLSRLEVYTAAGWQTVRLPTPITIGSSHATRVRVDGAARLLVGHGSSIWESAPIART